MNSTLRRSLPAIAGVLGILLLVALWRYIVAHPPCCDVNGYLVMSRVYLGLEAPSDLFAELREIRTYGYPALLAPLLATAKWIGADAALVIFVVQILLYWLAACFLAREYGHVYGKEAGRYAGYALLANVLIYPLLGIGLTDGTSVTLLFLMLAVALRWLRVQAAAEGATPWHLLYALPLGLLTGLALMVRPSNMAFAGVTVLALVFMAVVSVRKHGRSPDGVLALSLVAAGFLLVVLPQVAINVMHYGIWSFLPKANLGAGALEWGKSVLKYLTNLSGTEVQQCYRVPWAVPPGQGLGWYFLNPVTGFKTAALHLFGALDYDYLFPYVYNLKQPLRPLLFLYVHTALFLGTVGFVARAAGFRLARWGGAEFLVAASVGYLLFWAAIQSLAHAEVRYSIGASSMLLLFAPYGIAVVNRHRKRLLAAFAAYLVVAWLLSHFLAGLMAGCFGK